MIVFILTVTLAWWLTKVLWGERVGKFSLFILVPIGIFGSYVLYNAVDEDTLLLGFLLSIMFGIIFLAVNFIIWMVVGLIKADWSDPANRQAFLDGLLSNRSTSLDSSDEQGEYRIQYRNQVGTSWIDGPGSNSEHQAEMMFDSFINNASRGNRRARLVYKVNGKVRNVLSTN